jgi:hypothetical protein
MVRMPDFHFVEPASGSATPLPFPRDSTAAVWTVHLARDDEWRGQRDKLTRRAISSDFPKSCQAQESKIFRFRRRANQWFESARLTRQEGRLAIVTKRAVGCDGRGCADDERH